MSEVHNMREIENLEALVKSLEESNESLKQSVVDLIKEAERDRTSTGGAGKGCK